MLASRTLALAALAVGSIASAQGIPFAIQGLPLDPEIPYVPGSSVGPLGPIDSPEADADYIRFAEAWWTVIDNGGTDLSPLAGFAWLAPDLVALENGLDVSTQVDPWGGGMELFARLYAHKLAPNDPFGPDHIEELLSIDPAVAEEFKHWGHYHQVVTSISADPAAHAEHMALVMDALTFQSEAVVRGLPYMDGSTLVSDRLELTGSSSPAPAPTTPATTNKEGPAVEPGGGGPRPVNMLDKCIRTRGGVLDPFSGQLYKADKGYYCFGLLGGCPGFDCDDFADAIGAYIIKGKQGVTTCNVYCKWTSKNPNNGKKSKAAHLVTKIKSGDCYWLVDAQTGAISGPHKNGTPMDATPVLGGYNVCPGTVVTDQKDYEHGDRSPWSGEPPPWHTSPTIVACFEMITGLQAACFKVATVVVETMIGGLAAGQIH